MTTYLQCFWALFFSLSLYFAHSTSASTSRHVYIVYLGVNRFHNPLTTSNTHIQLLSHVFSSEEEAKKSLLYSYKHSFSGFSARLNSTQATSISNMKGVISVFRSKILKLHTTRSWDFLGLPLDYITNASNNSFRWRYARDVVVGVLDSGIWPESESFKCDPWLGPIPHSWRGKCEKGEDFEPKKACNNKLIGARYYLKGFEEEYGKLNKTNENSEFRSPRDFLGHGTHTASTAVGSITKKNVSFSGLGQGIARGGAVRARLAVYKTCWGKELEGKCAEADILAGFDEAILDGVDVISASFGAPPPLAPFLESSSDIGAFHGMQKGVSVVFSGGNDGPQPSLVGNVAPWSICVAASSIDRSFPTQIALNSTFSLLGESFVTKEITGKLANARMYFIDGVCMREKWNRSRTATGKIIICLWNSVDIGIAQEAVKAANGTALIYVEPPSYQISAVDILPTVSVDISQGTLILDFLSHFSKLPVIRILPSSSVIGKSPAPVVAPFSSRGPSSISPDFLKPDVSGPGVNILAAWPTKTPPTLDPTDTRSVEWNFQTGTSMSCPHVSALAALLKSIYPFWSPAAIRSALITTASTKDTSHDSIIAGGSRKAADPFDIGAGQINPTKAMDPGLVYDIKPSDYISFLCNIGYTTDQITALVLPSPGIQSCCPKTPTPNYNINYPSITVTNLNSVTKIKRTVRNVGKNRNAIYFASIVKPNGVEVTIWPPILVFSYFREEITYYVTVKPLKKSTGRYDFGEIVWCDGIHSVRSPLVVLVNNVDDDEDDDDDDEYILVSTI